MVLMTCRRLVIALYDLLALFDLILVVVQHGDGFLQPLSTGQYLALVWSMLDSKVDNKVPFLSGTDRLYDSTCSCRGGSTRGM